MVIKEFLFKNVKGNVAIEFAIVAPFLFLLLSGVMNFGLILANQNKLYSIVNAGILYAAGQSKTAAEVQIIMQAAIPTMSPLTVTTSSFCRCGGASATCSSTCSDGSTAATYITMTAQSSVTLVAPDFIIANPFPTSVTGMVRTN